MSALSRRSRAVRITASSSARVAAPGRRRAVESVSSAGDERSPEKRPKSRGFQPRNGANQEVGGRRRLLWSARSGSRKRFQSNRLVATGPGGLTARRPRLYSAARCRESSPLVFAVDFLLRQRLSSPSAFSARRERDAAPFFENRIAHVFLNARARPVSTSKSKLARFQFLALLIRVDGLRPVHVISDFLPRRV